MTLKKDELELEVLEKETDETENVELEDVELEDGEVEIDLDDKTIAKLNDLVEDIIEEILSDEALEDLDDLADMESYFTEEDLAEIAALEDLEKPQEEMATIALRGLVAFPNCMLNLDIGRDKSIKALDVCMKGNREIFLSMQKDVSIEDPKEADICEIGVIAEVKQVLKLPAGVVRVMISGLCRARIDKYTQFNPYGKAMVEELDEWETTDKATMEAMKRTLKRAFEDYAVAKKIPRELIETLKNMENPSKLADNIALNLPVPLVEKQEFLETVDICDRMEMLLRTLARETEIVDLEQLIHSRVHDAIEKNQKEYYLREQIKVINKELGENEDRSGQILNYRERMEKLNPPEFVVEKLEKEFSRLRSMPPMTAEANVVENFIDSVLDLPWGEISEDNKDILRAEEILNEDHQGLEKVKERILEYLAVRQMTDSLKGPIMCLVGPPGVGKTSLAASIARALGKKYVRLSLGGVRDEAEIRGHRRTYIGAMSGRIIQGMKTAGTDNPLFLLDEIDKLASDYKGDPASALLEVLDPAQNNTFTDHYLDMPYDLSKVMFLTTANVESNIPEPLWDRMEIIRLDSYTDEEKMDIATKKLLPKQRTEHGLKAKQLVISDNAMHDIIRLYTREAGVRSLEREIGKICRKTVKKIVGGEVENVRISCRNLKEYLGLPKQHFDMIDKKDQVGVVTGLAWTAVGGDTLTIEAQILPGKGSLILTGKLGDVMKESAQAGWTYLRSVGEKYGVPEDVSNLDIHIHVPEGAIPKDGPSAGITMATALASAFSKRPVRKDVAMTGEITLRGRVLPIGGLKEKSLAAKHAGVKTIFIPMENKKDLEEIPASVKEKVKFVPVSQLEEVLEGALV